jgi:RimJ/RimL family protein N-acetyltransferase
MKNQIIRFKRFINSLHRPTKRSNKRLLVEKSEDISKFIFREAREEEIPALANLHVITWHQTYNVTPKAEAWKIREWQWREQFKKNDGRWFCIVIENQKGELIGFAKGVNPPEGEHPEGSGNLSKIYLLRQYQRMGLGRKLLGLTVKRFLEMGVTSMVLFGEATNPSCAFHDAMGGKRMYNEKGIFLGNYSWDDLKQLAKSTPVE